jgi:hypothetical protein
MARILSPQEYYPSQTPMQARALGTQVGAMEREQALKQAQLGGEMKAAGAGTPQEMYYAQAMGRQAEARRKAAMEAVEESKNFFMDIPEMTKAHGVGPTQKWVNDTLASNPIYGKLFKDGIEVQKQGDTIYLNMGVAEESAPVPMLGEDGKVYQGNTIAGEKYRWVTDYSKSPDQRMYAERIPVTEADTSARMKARSGKVITPEDRMKRISAIEAAKVKLEQTGGIDPFMMGYLKDKGIDLTGMDVEEAKKVLDRERKVHESKLPESYRIKEEVAPKPTPDLDALLKEVM